MTVNDTTNSLTTKIIFGNNRKPQDQFNYRNMGDESAIFDPNADLPFRVDDYDEYTAFDKTSVLSSPAILTMLVSPFIVAKKSVKVVMCTLNQVCTAILLCWILLLCIRAALLQKICSDLNTLSDSMIFFRLVLPSSTRSLIKQKDAEWSIG